MRKLILITIFIAALPSLFVGQNAKQEIINLNKSHHKQNNVSMEMVSKVFEDNNSNPIQETKVIAYTAPGKYRYINASSESMANNDYKINVDHNRKIIIVGKITKQAPFDKNPNVEIFDKQDFSLKLDTVLKLYSSVVVKKINETTNEISFTLKTGSFDIIKVSYDSKTYKVQQCFLRSRTLPDQQHSYSCLIKYNYLPTENQKSEKFDSSNFILVQKKKITPVSKYAEYKLIDHSNQKG